MPFDCQFERRASGLSKRSARAGTRVDAAIQRIVPGNSGVHKAARLRPAPLTIAREIHVARETVPLSCARKAWVYMSGLASARYICAARLALCSAIDMPSPVNDGMTAA